MYIAVWQRLLCSRSRQSISHCCRTPNILLPNMPITAPLHARLVPLAPNSLAALLDVSCKQQVFKVAEDERPAGRGCACLCVRV